MSKAPPPLIYEPLYKKIQSLKSQAIKIGRSEKSPSPSMEHRLLEWILSLTPFQLDRPYTTMEVIKLASLVGKYRSRPALQEVAQLLRKHGFEHKRNWTSESRNQRYWKFKG